MRRPALVLCGIVLLCVTARGGPAGQTSLSIYFQSTLKDEAYQQRAFKKVAAAWKPPLGAAFPKIGTKTVVRAVIAAKDGRVASTDVSTTSGSKAWDAAVEKMVRGAAPYEPLPSRFPYPSYEAHFHMSYLAATR